MHRPDQTPPLMLTTYAPPSIAASVTLLHRIYDRRSREAGRLIGTAEGGVISAFAWWRVDDAPQVYEPEGGVRPPRQDDDF